MFRALVVITALASLCFLAAWLVKVPARITNTWINSLTEAQPVWGALQVAHKRPLLIDYRTSLPCVPITYGVLTYYGPGLMAGIAEFGPVGIAVIGRSVSFISCVAAFLLVVAIARQRNISWPFAAIAVSPLLWMPYCMDWATKFMPDFPALAWSLAGLYLLTNKNLIKAGKFIPSLATALCWTIAWHYKPITLVGPVVCVAEVCFAAVARDWQRVNPRILALIAYLLLVLATVLVLQVATGGFWYLNLVETAAQCRWIPGNPFQLLRERPGTGLMPVFFLIAIVRIRKSPLSLALVILISFELLFIMKEGSNINYIIGSLALGGIFLAGEVQEAWQRTTWEPVPYAIALGSSLCLLTVLFSTCFSAATVYFEEQPVPESDVVNTRNFIEPFSGGEILSLHPWLALRLGVSAAYMDGFHAGLLEREDVSDFELAHSALREKRYKYVLYAASVLPPGLVRTINANYEKREVFGRITIMAPKL